MERKKIIGSLIGSIWLALLIYIILHEGGHALVGILCGATVSEFNILEAYVVCEGGNFNQITSALFNLAGMLLPLLISWIYLVFYQKQVASIFYRIFSAVFIMATTCSTVAWVVVPIIYMVGTPNPQDDIVKFIEITGISPILLSGIALVLIGISCLGIWRKQVLRNYFLTMRKIKGNDHDDIMMSS